MEKLTLTRIANIIRSEWVLLIFGIFSIALFVLAVVTLTRPKPQEVQRGVSWKSNIVAGKTTKEELETKLGPPVKTQIAEDQLSYFYPSANQYRPHEIEFSQETISIIKEQVIGAERGTLDDYIQKYGQPEKILYGEHGTFAPGHFWGQVGLLVFAGQFDKTIVEIWYFTPTTADNLLTKNPQLSSQEPEQF